MIDSTKRTKNRNIPILNIGNQGFEKTRRSFHV